MKASQAPEGVGETEKCAGPLAGSSDISSCTRTELGKQQIPLASKFYLSRFSYIIARSSSPTKPIFFPFAGD